MSLKPFAENYTVGVIQQNAAQQRDPVVKKKSLVNVKVFPTRKSLLENIQSSPCEMFISP